MTTFSRLFVLVILCISTGNMAHADVREVRANTTTAVAATYYFDKRSCQIFPPGKVIIAKEPKNGTVTYRQERHSLPGACAGTTATVNMFYYTPNKGYRGGDQFRYRLTYPRHLADRIRKKSHTVKIKVE
ncbi:MAG: hypothetical protein AAFR71_04005 [Pseudomonadota bacterium]